MPPVDIAWLATGGLVTARIMGMFLIMPVVSMSGVPASVRVLAAIALAALIGPIAPPVADPSNLGTLLLGLASEVIVGVLLAGVVRLVFGSLALAGEMMGAQTGHAAALQFDPTLQLSQGPVGSLGTFLASAVFVGTNQHLQLFLAVGDSFFLLPPGSATNLSAGGAYWLQLGALVIQAGAQLASPIITMVFLINLTVALITRLSPQMNIFFALGIMLNMVLGQALYYALLPFLLREHNNMVRSAMELIPSIIVDVGGG